MLSGEAANTNFIVFIWPDPGSNPWSKSVTIKNTPSHSNPKQYTLIQNVFHKKCRFLSIRSSCYSSPTLLRPLLLQWEVVLYKEGWLLLRRQLRSILLSQCIWNLAWLRVVAFDGRWPYKRGTTVLYPSSIIGVLHHFQQYFIYHGSFFLGGGN